MTRSITAALLCPLLVACAGAQNSEGFDRTETAATRPTTTGDEDPASTTGAVGSDTGSGEPDATGSAGSSGPGCTPLPWFPDHDGDGFGPDGAVVMHCDAPPEHVPNGGDCNDANAAIHIAAEETCDQADNDCDGLIDEPAASNPSCGGCALVEMGASGYAFCSAALPWAQAQANCEASFGGTLITIDSGEENTAVLALDPNVASAFWLGLSDLDLEGTFVWLDGTPVGYTGWNAGEPNDAGSNEDCAQLVRSTAAWNDVDCTVPRSYICEVPL